MIIMIIYVFIMYIFNEWLYPTYVRTLMFLVHTMHATPFWRSLSITDHCNVMKPTASSCAWNKKNLISIKLLSTCLKFWVSYNSGIQLVIYILHCFSTGKHGIIHSIITNNIFCQWYNSLSAVLPKPWKWWVSVSLFQSAFDLKITFDFGEINN